MSKNQQLKYQTIIEFIEGKLTRQQAGELLHVHERTVSRLANKIRKRGYLGLAHENLGRKPVNRTPDGLCEMVMDLVKKRYFDFNMIHTLELLKQEQGTWQMHSLLGNRRFQLWAFVITTDKTGTLTRNEMNPSCSFGFCISAVYESSLSLISFKT